MVWEQWINKRVFIVATNKNVYQGVVSEVTDMGDGIIFIGFHDKFNQFVMIRTTDIVIIREENKNGKWND